MWRTLYANLIGRIAFFTCENIAHIEFYLQGFLPKILAIYTIKCNKKGWYSPRLFMFIYLFHIWLSGICLALTMLPVILRVKELNGESYTLYWNLKSSFSRSDAWRPRNDALSLLHPEELGLRVERKNSLVNAKSNMAEEESFEARKQLLLTSYFEISSTEELKNYQAI